MQGEMTELLENLEVLTNFMSLFKIDDDKTIKAALPINIDKNCLAKYKINTDDFNIQGSKKFCDY